MSIVVSCRCGKRFKAADQHAGKRAKCPGCGEAIVIPAPAPRPTAAKSPKPTSDGLDDLMSLAEPEVFTPAARRADAAPKKTSAAPSFAAAIPPLSKRDRSNDNQGSGPLIQVPAWLIVIIILAVLIPAAIYWAKQGPLKAQHDWTERSRVAEDQIPWQVVRGIQQYYSEIGLGPDDLPYHPKVMLFNFADPKFMLSLPDKVLFFGRSTDGAFNGKYNPQNWQFEADVTIGGKTHHMTGNASTEDNTLTLDGKPVK